MSKSLRFINAAKSNITGIRKMRTVSLRGIVKTLVNGIDRQGIPGLPAIPALPSIPPVAAFIGFSTAVAVTGVAAQTGVLEPLLETLSNLISKRRLIFENRIILNN